MKKFMSIKTIDQIITNGMNITDDIYRDYKLINRMNGDEFCDNGVYDYIYIIEMKKSKNAYRIFLGDKVLGLQCLKYHFFDKNGIDYGYDEPCDYKWLDYKYSGIKPFDDITTIVNNNNKTIPTLKKWLRECENDGIFTETIIQ